MAKREVVNEVAVAEVPVGPVEIPSEGTFERVALGKLAEQYAALLPTASILASLGASPEGIVVSTNDGRVAVLEMAKDGHAAKELFITPANTEYLVAALANLPGFRAKFAEVVIKRIEEGRAGAEYQGKLARLNELRAEYGETIAAMREMTKAIALPFVAEHFVDTSNVEAVVTKASAMAQSTSDGRQRRRQPTEVQWNRDLYIYPPKVNGEVIQMVKHSEDLWIIQTEAGIELARGYSPSNVTKAWYRSRGMSDAVSAPNVWDAVAQEQAGH